MQHSNMRLSAFVAALCLVSGLYASEQAGNNGKPKSECSIRLMNWASKIHFAKDQTAKIAARKEFNATLDKCSGDSGWEWSADNRRKEVVRNAHDEAVAQNKPGAALVLADKNYELEHGWLRVSYDNIKPVGAAAVGGGMLGAALYASAAAWFKSK